MVVQDGQRVSGQLHEKQDTAKAEAEALQKKRPVVEAGQGAPAPEAPKVVQNLYG